MLYIIFNLILFFGSGNNSDIPDLTNSQDTETVVVGSTVPSFTLKDQYGELFNVDSVLGKKNLVIYFYPKDGTSGCTAQACSFRDQFEAFEKTDAMIIGVSEQSVESHLEFTNENMLNFTLLSDPENKVRYLFDVPSTLFGLIPGRVTYVVDKFGKVVLMFDSQLDVEKHIDEALRILLEMQKISSGK
jgi:thioredoxin-dependent peroxiredoxin